MKKEGKMKRKRTITSPLSKQVFISGQFISCTVKQETERIHCFLHEVFIAFGFQFNPLFIFDQI